jgi:Tfp pilus assembly protein PilF
MFLFFLCSLGCAPKELIIPPPPKPIERTTSNHKSAQKNVLKAWYHTHRNEWDKASKFFDHAIQDEPKNPWTFIHLGDAALQVGHHEITKEAWETALSLLLPSDIQIRIQLRHKLEQNEL